MTEVLKLLRVVLADDQHLVLEGLKRVFSERRGFQIVAEAGTEASAVSAVAGTTPDLVIMDMRLGRTSGADATRQIKVAADAPPVLVLTTYDDDDTLRSALTAGADGFALKDAGGPDLVRAARAVADGGTWLDPTIAGRVVTAFRSVKPPGPASDRLELLTPRERDVLRGLASGRTNAEIAANLDVGEGTVKTHVSHVLAKLGVRDRVQAVIFAFDVGLVVAGDARAFAS